MTTYSIRVSAESKKKLDTLSRAEKTSLPKLLDEIISYYINKKEEELFFQSLRNRDPADILAEQAEMDAWDNIYD